MLRLQIIGNRFTEFDKNGKDYLKIYIMSHLIHT